MTKKFDIFGHLIETMFLNSNKEYKFIDDIDKAVISGLSAASFNIVNLGQLNIDLINELKDQNIPFICIPQANIEKDFKEFCENQGLIFTCEIQAREYEDLDKWEYRINKTNINIQEVENINDLKIFDEISYIAFEHPKGYAAEFLKFALNHSDVTLFLAYENNIAVGCGMVTIINNIAGLYWGGVLPEYRKKGIATALTEYRMNFSKQKGLKNVVVQNMPLSVNYYQKIGFQLRGSLSCYMFLGK